MKDIANIVTRIMQFAELAPTGAILSDWCGAQQ